ncbi:MAG: succinate dehydrogenase/fumarate reductase iron-sulfur subunit [Gemmatimonadetes bacterium]|nr:succinate dehydrogenase/fumarate reductase iron-sulfur subunit [Gemmatimonadota bacterium]
MNLTLHIWRQANRSAKGGFETYEVSDISADMSFLEMLDVLNERLVTDGKDPIAFDHDCREGICGTCGMMVNGYAHGPWERTTVCQLHMRAFEDGEEITIEPWRAQAFPVLRDLVVDRGAFDRIIASGGYISVRTGAAPDANAIAVPKENADLAFDAAECIGCGACVAACPNASAMLFTASKVSHLNLLPQGQPERDTRTRSMVAQMNEEAFGHCTNHGACQEACPKGISVDYIARLNRDLYRASRRRPGSLVD